MLRNYIIRPLSVYFSHIDPLLSGAVLLLLIGGILNMYGVVGGESLIMKKQVIFVFVGMFVMAGFSIFNYRYLKNYSLPVLALYLFSLILLGLTFASESVRGTNSWISLGIFTFEPAELTKLCLIILMAKYYSQKHVHINQLSHIVAPGIYFLVPLLLILNQPDLGSAIILSLIWASLLIAAGINWKQACTLVMIVSFLLIIGWFFVFEPYQKARVLSFFDQGSDPLGAGYNLIQSKIAIGSGFWLGNGLGKGSQANLGFLPEPHNDFIFAAFAEQFGFVGIVFLIGLTSLITYRILMIGLSLPSNFGKLFSVGLAVFVFSHFFVSAGVNTGLMPVTGLPFPFLSAGGSNLVSIMAGLGILQSIKYYG